MPLTLQRGIVHDVVVAPQGTPDMTVSVTAGVILFDNVPVPVAAVAALTIGAAHATLPRWDFVQVDSTGVVTVLAGTPTAPDSLGMVPPPTIDTTKIVLASVYVAAAVTTITASALDAQALPVSPTSATLIFDSGRLTAPVSSIDFNNIPQNYMGLLFHFLGASTDTGRPQPNLKFNGDGGTDYIVSLYLVNQGLLSQVTGTLVGPGVLLSVPGIDSNPASVSTRLWPSSAAWTAIGAGYTNPTNASKNDGVAFATAVLGASSGEVGDKYGNFGFNGIIPAGSSIIKVEILFKGKVSGSGTETLTGRIRAVVGGTDQANHDVTEGATLTSHSYDVTADRAWTRADLLDGTFEVAVAGLTGAGTGTVTHSIQDVTAKITYAATIGQYSFSSLWVPFYTSPDAWKICYVTGGRSYSNLVADQYSDGGMIQWRNQAAITRVTVDSVNFQTGTRLVCFGF
jgi:hypothetical protein